MRLKNAPPARPLFMWAGGKTRLLKHYSNVAKPLGYDFYIEPFFGGGAVFLSEAPEYATINDVNDEIMSIYRKVRDNPSRFLKLAQDLAKTYLLCSDRKQFYYELRESYWEKQSPALLYILMKLGFNGIWQTCKASKGLFGTPSGLLNQTKLDQIVDRQNILSWSERLASVNISSTDYKDVEVPPNSFLYLDPPYRGSFTTYGTVFGDEDQRCVVEYALAASRHSTVWLANRSLEGDKFFEELLPYSKFHYFDVTYTAGRRKTTEQGFEALKAREFLCEVRIGK